MRYKKCILLNPTRDTTAAFTAHFGNTVPVHAYKTKQMILHIRPNGEPEFHTADGPLSFTDAYVFVRVRGNDSHFCGMLTEYFKVHAIPTNDPVHALYKNSAGKISQMLLLTLASIQVPETIIFREESFQNNRAYIEKWAQFPLVYKTDGKKGRQVHVVNTFPELEALVQSKKPYKRALIQPFIENTFDTRTLTAYGEILGTIKRARTHGYLNNISQGGIASLYTLTEEEKAIALKAAKVCRIDFAGIDMIHTDNGPVILEVNKSPQVQGFDSIHTGSALQKVAAIIERTYFISPQSPHDSTT